MICIADERKRERGFVLVTSLVLLAILTILGIAAFFKTNVQVKVSASAAQSEQAFAAMNAGLNKVFADWSANNGPGSEFKTLADWVTKGTGTAPAIYVNAYPASVAAIGGNPPAGARVYTIGANGNLSTGTAWGVGSDPQVAVWVTSFDPPSSATDFPYVTPTHVTSSATKCPTCSLVVYALGRSGSARSLGREYMSTVTRNIQAFGAMMNAPKYANLTERCNNASSPNVPSNYWSSGMTGSVHTHMIDSTQAP
ncbi:hypothetical protein D6779_06615, partial [Candidatus Parcubacteria bacterium]